MLREMSVREGLWFALGTGCAYVLFLQLNIHVIQAQDAFPGVSVFFLPAGVKLLAILIGRHWGALGLVVANFLMSMLEWPYTPKATLLLMACVWAGTTLLVVIWLAGRMRLRQDLRGMTFVQFIVMDAVAACSHALVYNGLLVGLGNRHPEEWLPSATAMAMGDFLGSGAMMLMLLLTVRMWTWRRAP